MNLRNLIEAAVLLATGIAAVWLYIRQRARLRDLDGFIGVTEPEEKSHRQEIT